MKLIHTIRGSRRGILRGIGAGAIASAATLFAEKPGAAGATALAPLCCNLAHPSGPNFIDYADCHRRAAYIWGCAASGSLYCTCCETRNNAQSAAQCLHSK